MVVKRKKKSSTPPEFNTPIEKPEGNYYWDEDNIKWVEVDLESINTNNI